MNKYRVSAISYTNTKPFVYGLQHSGIAEKIDLNFDIPAECAQKLIEDKVDIGIVPVAALLHIPNHYIISDYCIGAVGAVNSVFIFSKLPVTEIETLQLDRQSRTSNNLAKVLLKNYWHTAPQIVEGEADAFVEIGDRTFGKKDKFPFVYDLAEEWQKFTGLPFVFAVWASNKPVSEEFISEFNAALKFGLDHRKEVIAEISPRADFDFEDYLLNKISYNLDSRKKEALQKYLYLVEDL
ncbi:menaquinone biosynthetic enzyme MqnA/MqnD family protein [Rubrolithibacter danxiaensis]|uniref:menaquinone biosynthetic enzyme MqnA/MqnD family protein n=1 Tax=Rubrolithibacter danxiaensis TaxID=3390805 RepID=UPI003BF7DF85